MEDVSQNVEQILRGLTTRQLHALKMRTRIGEEDLKEGVSINFNTNDSKVILGFINKFGINEFNKILDKVLEEYLSAEVRESTKLRMTTKTEKFSHLIDLLCELPIDELVELKIKIDEGYKQVKLWLWNKLKWNKEPYSTFLNMLEKKRERELKTAVVMSLQVLERKSDAALLTEKDRKKARAFTKMSTLKPVRRRKIFKKRKLPPEVLQELGGKLKKS
ncbi:MAG: hypothetical protein ACTSYM_03765 [Candidatus Baldrarchaeia archaeon]